MTTTSRLVFATVLLAFLGGLLWVPPSDKAGAAVATGPLRVLSSNPRYFTDDSGRAIYLTGSHTWNNLNEDPTIPPVDYRAYLDFLHQYNHNFIRLWNPEGVTGSVPDQPFRYLRPGLANEDLLKVDVNQFDPAHFDRIRDRVIQARDHGIYVGIMLFRDAAADEGWPYHFFNGANNVNGIHADTNGNGFGEEVYTLQIPEITRLQEAYVRRVIDTVNDLDNVLYEIGNEIENSTQWQYHMINYIHDYQAGRIDGVVRKQHPVGMTFGYPPPPGDNDLFNSPAEWISPGSDQAAYRNNPPATEGRKVILLDPDHLGGVVGDGVWVWKSFTRGYNPIYMDPIDFTQPNQSFIDPTMLATPGDILSARLAMGQTRTYANRMNLASMTPRGDLTSTTYALASPGNEYLIYQPGSGSFTINLSPGTYSYEWFNPSSRRVTDQGTITASEGHRSFTPPFSGDAVLYLKSAGFAP